LTAPRLPSDAADCLYYPKGNLFSPLSFLTDVDLDVTMSSKVCTARMVP
jgi:hypothetical protein